MAGMDGIVQLIDIQIVWNEFMFGVRTLPEVSGMLPGFRMSDLQEIGK